jgi:hypothetical protein
VLLVFAAPGQLLSLAGREHGRTIPLADPAVVDAGDSRRLDDPRALRLRLRRSLMEQTDGEIDVGIGQYDCPLL